MMKWDVKASTKFGNVLRTWWQFSERVHTQTSSDLHFMVLLWPFSADCCPDRTAVCCDLMCSQRSLSSCLKSQPRAHQRLGVSARPRATGCRRALSGYPLCSHFSFSTIYFLLNHLLSLLTLPSLFSTMLNIRPLCNLLLNLRHLAQ